jgi:indole-3-glycerol phosphate synthase
VSFLDRILAQKRREVAARRERTPLGLLEPQCSREAPPRSLERALRDCSSDLAVIAEVKKASPSKGVIRRDFDPVAIATAYERAGAAAVSVLTDEEHFQGSLEHLREVRRRVALPVLRKDFILDPYQVWEARAAGADAVLLILAALEDDGVVEELRDATAALGMEALWEVHELEELERLQQNAASWAPKLVGINNRDLRSFEVSLETTRKLRPHVPAGCLAVSESGFFTRAEIDTLRSWGADAFLIGESLLRAPDPGRALEELLRAG